MSIITQIRNAPDVFQAYLDGLGPIGKTIVFLVVGTLANCALGLLLILLMSLLQGHWVLVEHYEPKKFEWPLGFSPWGR